MRKSYGLAALVVLAMIALGIAAYPHPKATHAAVTSNDLGAELARLKSELADERRARERVVEKLEAQLRALASAQQSVSVRPALAATAAIAAPAARADDLPPDPIDPHEHLESHFAEQPTDARWAPAAEQQLEQTVREKVQGARVQSVECHASMCRLETVHTDVAAYGRFVAEAFKDPSKRIWNGDAYTEEPIEGAGGELVVVSYLAREGEPLPNAH